MGAKPSTPILSSTPPDPTSSSGFTVPSWIPYTVGSLATVVGIILLIVANQTNVGNDTVKQNYNLGGSLLLIIGFAGIVGKLGFFGWLKDFFSVTETRKAGATIFIVLATTIAIFVALFYNYASSETVSFASAILAILGVVGVFAVLYTYSGKISIANLISRSLLILYYFMPYALFSFGIITDIITRQLQFTGASFTGLTAVLFNYAISLVYTGGNPIDVQGQYNLCEIPGLAFLRSILAPQSMVSVLSTLAYIATYISRSTPGQGFAVAPEYRWPAWALFFGVFGLQYFTLASTGCLANQDGIEYPWNPKVAPLVAMVVSLAYGGIMGAIAFEVLEGRSDTQGASSAGGSPVLGATAKAPSGGSTTPTVGTCAAGSSDGEFICESFENGKLKRTVMTE
jgi:hypothetical protein